jgi:integrase
MGGEEEFRGSNPTPRINTEYPEPVSIEDYRRWACRRYSLQTVERDEKVFRLLQKHGMLDKEQAAVVDFIFTYPVSVGTRQVMMNAYMRWLRYLNVKPELSTLEALHDIDRLRPRKLAKIPSIHTVKAVISAMRPGQSKNFWVLIMETGLRFSEAYNLLWSQIDLSQKQLIMERSEKRSEGSILPLSDLAIQALEDQRRRSSGGRVFTVNQRTLIKTLTTARRRLSYLQDAALVNAKNIRHVYATRLYATTKDIVYVQRMLRHRSILTTQRYIHMITDRKAFEVKVVPQHDRETIASLLEQGFDVVLTQKDAVYLRRLKE